MKNQTSILIGFLILCTSLFPQANVFVPGTHNDWDLDGDNQTVLKDGIGGDQDFYGITIPAVFDNAFKIVEESWDNNWGSGYWITAYDQAWTIGWMGTDALWKDSPRSYVHLCIEDPTEFHDTTIPVGIMTLSALPVDIISVEQVGEYEVDHHFTDESDQAISITLSGDPSPEENIFLRYTTDGWVTDHFVLAAPVRDSEFSATIPGQITGTIVNYYVLSTTLDWIENEDLDTNTDLMTIHYNSNDGYNYGYNVGCTDIDGDNFCVNDDCNDDDLNIYPGADEVPDDFIDQDCNGFDTVTCYVDDDQDGFGNIAGNEVLADDGSCDTPDSESDNATDCDDTHPDTYPDALDIPDDTVDQDCNGFDTITCFQDDDQDGFGNYEGNEVLADDGSCDTIDGESDNSSDCDDTHPDTYPGAFDIPDDTIDQNCDGHDTITCFEDFDQDGFGNMNGITVLADDANCDTADGESDNELDCVDDDETIFPGALELPEDGIDQDCNGSDSIFCFMDNDQDGFGDGNAGQIEAPDGVCDTDQGESDNDLDCVDDDEFIYPGAIDLPDDGIDQNCDGFDTITCFQDNDQDGFGDGGNIMIEADDGFCDLFQFESENGMDCDDDNDQVYPDAPEFCDGINSDCDEFGDGSENLTAVCGFSDVGVCEIGFVTCDDDGNWQDCTAIVPSAEICDGLDNDCNGLEDDGLVFDCNGVCEGSAFDNVCGCVGGNTGLDPLFCFGCTDPDALNFDPDATEDDDSCEYLEVYGCTDAGACNFNPDATEDDDSCLYLDCNDDCGGSAIMDECEICCDGTTGVECSWYNSSSDFGGAYDCNEVCNGSAVLDECGVCCGGTTGHDCGQTDIDCNGDCFGSAYVDDCSVCCGGNTGEECSWYFSSTLFGGAYDCSGTCFGDAQLDSEDTCCTPDELDCLGFCFGGFVLDDYDNCCESQDIDCADLCFGNAVLDDCGICDDDPENDNACYGCTDPDAVNYDPDATLDDDSCEYDFLPGDLNGDNTVNVTDIVILVGIILSGEPADPALLIIADLYEDGVLSVLDLVIMVDIILYGNRQECDDIQSAVVNIQADQVSIITVGDAAGIQLETDGDFRITENLLSENIHLAYNAQRLIILSLDGSPIPSGPLFNYGGSLSVTGGEVADWNLHSILPEIQILPEAVSLKPAYPNPFNPVVTLGYTVAEPAHVVLSIYNLSGQRLVVIEKQQRPSGSYEIHWDAGDYPSGIYLVSLSSGTAVESQKIVLMK